MRNARGILVGIVAWMLLSSASPAHAQTEDKQWNVAILIFHDVQIIDFTGPWEVLGNASANDHERFNVFTVAEKAEPITTIGGLSVNPKYTFDNHPKPNVVLLPGGWGVYAARKKPNVIAWIQKTSRDAQIVFSVCNGAFFLAQAGLLEGQQATTNAGAVARLQKEVPSATIVDDQRFVDSGKIVTSAGLSAGIDGALHVVSRILGEGWAQRAAISMEYDWRPDSGYSRARLADRFLIPPWLMPAGLREPVVYSGDKNRWETKTIVHSADLPAPILEQVDAIVAKHFATLGWAYPKRDPSSDEMRSSWRFADATGRPWTATFQVERAPNDSAKWMLTMRVQVSR